MQNGGLCSLGMESKRHPEEEGHDAGPLGMIMRVATLRGGSVLLDSLEEALGMSRAELLVELAIPLEMAHLGGLLSEGERLGIIKLRRRLVAEVAERPLYILDAVEGLHETIGLTRYWEAIRSCRRTAAWLHQVNCFLEFIMRELCSHRSATEPTCMGDS